LFGLRVENFRNISAGGGADFGADHIARKAGAEEARVKRREFALVERAADVREAALQARANEAGLVGFREDGFDGGVDVRSGTPRVRSSRAMRKRPWRRDWAWERA